MTNKFLGWCAVLAVAICFSACAKKSDVDTAKLESSFAQAEPGQKNQVDTAVNAVKAGDYPAALASLQSIAAQAKLTPEQQQAIKDVMAQIQQRVGEVAEKAAGDAQKTMDDMKKALPKP